MFITFTGNLSVDMNDLLYKNKTLNLGGKLISLDTPLILGILNVTPDSFYDGGKYMDIDTIRKQIEKIISEGADIIDVGGYSSRPGGKDISPEEEFSRVEPALRIIKNEFSNVPVSLDTFRSEVARKAFDSYGISLVNDISAGELDSEMFESVAKMKIPYIMMHMRGTPQSMNSLTDYVDMKKEIFLYFAEKINLLNRKGVHDIILDPGFGFAKTIDQNFQILSFLHDFAIFEEPVLVGISRKSMIYKTLDTSPENSLNGTTALHMTALEKGAKLLRVHDVKEARETITLFKKLTDAKNALIE